MKENKTAKAISDKLKKTKKMVGKFTDKLEKNQHLFSILVPIIAGLLFLGLAAINLTSSIWFDESYSAYLVRGNADEIWNLTAQDVHPPLFYLALKAWASIFGHSDVAMRFMSVFFGLIAIVFIFHLVKRWFGIKAATASTLCAAVSPMFIRYAQEMRMYTMVLAIVFAATYFLSLALDNAKDKKGRKYWIIYAVLVSLGMWTHYFSAFVWLTHVVMILIHFGGVKKFWKDKKALKTVLLTYGLSVVLYLPWIPFFLTQVSTVQKGFWIPEVSVLTPVDFISNVLLFANAEDVRSWLFIIEVIFVAVYIIAYLKTRKTLAAKKRNFLKYFGLLFVLPTFLMIVLSLPPLKPMFVDRYILYSAVAAWIIFGIAIATVKDDRFRNLLVVLLIVIAGFGICNIEKREPKGYVKDIMAELYIGAEENEPIIANGPWIYYDGIFYENEKHPFYVFSETFEYEYGSLYPIRDYHKNVIDNAKEFLEDHEKVWYVYEIPEDGKKFKLPELFDEYHVISEISLDHHCALELSK